MNKTQSLYYLLLLTLTLVNVDTLYAMDDNQIIDKNPYVTLDHSDPGNNRDGSPDSLNTTKNEQKKDGNNGLPSDYGLNTWKKWADKKRNKRTVQSTYDQKSIFAPPTTSAALPSQPTKRNLREEFIKKKKNPELARQEEEKKLKEAREKEKQKQKEAKKRAEWQETRQKKWKREKEQNGSEQENKSKTPLIEKVKKEVKRRREKEKREAEKKHKQQQKQQQKEKIDTSDPQTFILHKDEEVQTFIVHENKKLQDGASHRQTLPEDNPGTVDPEKLTAPLPIKTEEDGDPEEVDEDDWTIFDDDDSGHRPSGPPPTANPRTKTGLFGLSAGAAAIGFKNHALNMNNLWVTAGVMAAFELFHVQKLLLKLPLPEVFKQRLASSVRGGLYASVASALGERLKVPLFSKAKYLNFPQLFKNPLNGWKIIGSYMLIDLISKYGLDIIRNITSQSENENSQEQTEPDQSPTSKSNVKTVLGWSVKTILAGVVVNTLTPSK